MSLGLNQISEAVIGGAIEVHRELGPGLLESSYETCLVYELLNRGLEVQRQVELPVIYKNQRVECGYRIDILINGQIILEIKAVTRLEPIHQAQLLTYLRLSGCQLGLLINFNVCVLKDGIKRLVHNFQET